MKKIIIKSYLVLTTLLISSCSTDLDINQDPDLLSPSQIPMENELPAAITGIGASAGSYFALIGGFWSQFWTQSAVANQYKYLDDYTLNPSQPINEGGWASMYDALTDVRNVKANALATENWKYYLIATTLEVYASQILVDYYGAIPYSEANNTAILKPVFDAPEVVYDKMALDLAEALGKDLSTSPVAFAPGTTDFIFKGDMTKWTEFANTLMLKIHMRQSEVRPSVASAGIIGLIGSGVNFLSSNAAIDVFVDENSRSNPLYESDRRQLNVATNLRASTTMGTFLKSNIDPRLAKFYDGDTFQDQGYFDNPSGTSVSVVELSATSPVYFISLAESKFLQAEADLKYMGGTNAKALYEAAVTAAFEQWGLGTDAAAMLTGAYSFPTGTDSDKLEAIMTQKWVASFPGNGYESFVEHNRTGFPKVSTVKQTDAGYKPGQITYSIEGKTGGLFPKRIEYPLTETIRNSNTPAVVKITEAVWYDK